MNGHMKEPESAEDKSRSVSRREFLKIAGVAGATIGLAGGLGGVLAGCGEEETTTTAAPETTTTAGPETTTTAAPETTTTTAGPETGRAIKVGCVIPKTGALSTFVIPFEWCHEQWMKALSGGVVLGDGKNHAIETSVFDTQSDTARCAQVTGDLITNEKVDIIFAAGSPDTMMPAADQCEALECPGLCIQGPWEAFYFGRGGTPDNNPFKWANALCVGVDAMDNSLVDAWNKIQTNKKCGLIYSNDPNGQALGSEENGGPYYYKQAGYTYTLASPYPPGTEDYTAPISEFKKFGAEIFSGVFNSADFTTMWKQCLQQGYNPKIVTPQMALTFVETLEAIGDTASGMTCEVNWHPAYPYTSPLTGLTCQEIADTYEADTGHGWNSDLMIHSLMEWFVGALQNTANVDDKEAVLTALLTTKVDSMYGPIDFTMPVDPTIVAPVTHTVPNCLRMPLGAAQWVKDSNGKWQKVLVSNKYCEGAQVQGTILEMNYA
jgi:branched-chain amino acid transport system substrate-binding protein